MRKKKSMLSISLPLANFLFNLSSVVLVLGAVAVLAGTIGTVWTGSVKERYGDERIAANEAETARAKESAALANERSLKLAVELEQERVARIEIEGRVREQGNQVKGLMPRRLSEDQISSIIEIVSRNPSSISLTADMAAPDIKPLVSDLASAFQKAGWTVSAPGVMGIHMPPSKGIGLQVSSTGQLTEKEKLVKLAFEKALIAFDVMPNSMPEFPGRGRRTDVDLLLTTPAR